MTPMTDPEKRAYSRKVVSEFMNDLWNDRRRALSSLLPTLERELPAPRPAGFDWFTVSPLAREWLYMAEAGLGLVNLPRKNEDPERAQQAEFELYLICQDMVEMLFAIPGQQHYSIPAFWADHPMGQLWSLTMVWLSGSDLVTVTEAARLAGVTTQAIAGRISRGTLRSFIDPNAPARQGRRLVSRKDVTS